MMHRQEHHKVDLVACKDYEEERSLLSTGLAGRSVLDQEQSPLDESSPCSTSPKCSAPLCRQFWKAGNYEHGLVSNLALQKGNGYLHIHPKFLHSNATSHKWVFGAIAELLDNAVDEIQNGATFAVVDKTLNPRDGSSALLIQDDGGGMDPDAMRRCLSFGFSDKKSKSAIGKYGNGFKTSSMRLGADVIVFSRHMQNRKRTQSIGLLSYTFLMQSGCNRIVVPMVDYELILETNTWKTLSSEQHHMNNLSFLLQWSPYSAEVELLKQFEDVGHHGTKIIVYNLWCNDDGNMELDFESDPEDIRISGKANKNRKGPNISIMEHHLANRLHFSLRAYLSILYLRVPENFCILLRGRVLEYHHVANDLKYPEFILYRPQISGCREVQVITTIGFLKEAPNVNVHGFNVYHKNRLILPFWHVVSSSGSRGRGVVGVLEANFIEPTHDKQGFEKTAIFQKLEQRLKEMTWEYWDYHCGLLGYQVQRKTQAMTSQCDSGQYRSLSQYHSFNFLPGNQKNASHRDSEKGTSLKRKAPDHLVEPEWMKRKVGSRENTIAIDQEILPVSDGNAGSLQNQEAANLIKEQQKLHAKCLEYKKSTKELNRKVNRLRIEIGEARHEYIGLLAELKSLRG